MSRDDATGSFDLHHPLRQPAGLAAALALALLASAGLPVPSDAIAETRAGSGSGSALGRGAAPSVLPMMQSLVPEEMREALPLPIGLSLGYFYESEDLDAQTLGIELGGDEIADGDVRFAKLDHATQIYMLRADAWVLPFLDVYGLVGYLDGAANHVEVDLRGLRLPTLAVDYHGSVFGVGSTIAGGWGPAFASFDFNYMAADVDILDTTVSILTLGPRVGWRTSLLRRSLVLYGGASYQGIQGSQSGTTHFEGVPVQFSVVVRSQEPWTGVVGAQLELDRHLALVTEGGIGNRSQALVSLRFAL